jgi:hypothetical protein
MRRPRAGIVGRGALPMALSSAIGSPFTLPDKIGGLTDGLFRGVIWIRHFWLPAGNRFGIGRPIGGETVYATAGEVNGCSLSGGHEGTQRETGGLILKRVEVPFTSAVDLGRLRRALSSFAGGRLSLSRSLAPIRPIDPEGKTSTHPQVNPPSRSNGPRRGLLLSRKRLCP